MTDSVDAQRAKTRRTRAAGEGKCIQCVTGIPEEGLKTCRKCLDASALRASGMVFHVCCQITAIGHRHDCKAKK